MEADFFKTEDGHACSCCDRQLSENECDIFDMLAYLENGLSKLTKMSLIYIAGYIDYKTNVENEATGTTILNDTFQYYKNFGGFLNVLDRGGFTKLCDSTCQWTIYCYIFFTALDFDVTVCRKSLAFFYLYIFLK